MMELMGGCARMDEEEEEVVVMVEVVVEVDSG